MFKIFILLISFSFSSNQNTFERKNKKGEWVTISCENEYSYLCESPQSCNEQIVQNHIAKERFKCPFFFSSSCSVTSKGVELVTKCKK